MYNKKFAFIVMLLPVFLLLSGPLHIHDIREGFRHEAFEVHAAEETDLYTCSMHPFIIQEGPGNCPICSMTLVPVRQDGTTAAATGGSNIITIDPSTRQNMGVRTIAVAKHDMTRTVRTVGLVGYDETRQYTVNAKVDGWIEKLFVNETGRAVQKGEPLLEIYSPDLVAAQEEFLLAVRSSKTLGNSPFAEIAAGARNLLAASRKRLSYWDISEAQIDAIGANGQVSKTLTLLAPASGVVTRKGINAGAFVRAGTELFELADISRVWVYADIYEYELPWVRTGQPAVVHFPYPRAPLNGKISTIYPYVEARTRTVKARIDVANTDLGLKPDMYVNVVIEGQSARNALAVPVEAVLRSGRQETVFVSLGEGRFEPRLVKTGLETDDGLIQVIEGVHEGEEIVISAQFMLDSESKLREAVRKLLPPPVQEKLPSLPPATGDQPPAGETLNDLFK